KQGFPEFQDRPFALTRARELVLRVRLMHLLIPREPAGIADELPIWIMQRNGDATFEKTAVAKPQAEVPNGLFREASVTKIWVVCIESLQFEIHRRIHDDRL